MDRNLIEKVRLAYGTLESIDPAHGLLEQLSVVEDDNTLYRSLSSKFLKDFGPKKQGGFDWNGKGIEERFEYLAVISLRNYERELREAIAWAE